ncbi:MAG: hypothetical protein QNL12_04025 [Acidimicrobiia bacterium]|nr:hypothetical protein [Acidimicrobiia bacterium]MDX2466459.1 hypothetical protein [Acidimicrobiia bacterium]
MRMGTLTALLAAALILLTGTTDLTAAQPEAGFSDVSVDSVFAEPITWLRLSGITHGCNPPSNSAFCPTEPVTRGQMAAFLSRALPTHNDRFCPNSYEWQFIDTTGSILDSGSRPCW